MGMIFYRTVGKALALIVPALMFSSMAFGRGECRPQTALNISIPVITTAPNIPVGQPVGAPGGYAFDTGGGFAMTCFYREWPFSYYHESRLNIVNSAYTGRTFNASGLSLPVYATSVPGVGFAMMAKDPNHPFRAISHTGTTLFGTSKHKPGGWGLQGRVYLVATGPITGGTISSLNIARFTVSDSDIHAPGYHSVNFRSVVISPPLKPTCSVSTKALAIRLGSVANRDFRGVGSHAGSATENIVLTCAGSTGTNADVLITVTDQAQPSNRSDRLTTSGTARGVALQLLRATTLIRYGADSATIGNPNQWQAGSTGNGQFRIPLTARYIQTLPSITPGTANGVATFTMAYR